MLDLLKRTYTTYFPPRQVLVRQNGEVKYISIAPPLQLGFTLSTLALVCWFSYSSYKNIVLADEVTQANQQVFHSKEAMHDLSKVYQEKHEALTNQLKQLKSQQSLIENIVGSLPDSIAPNQQLVEDAKSENAETNAEEMTGAYNSPTLLQDMDHTFTELSELALAQATTLNTIKTQVAHRHQTLKDALVSAGFHEEAILAQQPSDTTAQGGPLSLLTDNDSLEQSDLANELLSLLTLESALSNLPLTLPVAAKNYYISSRYGIRKDPIKRTPAMHKGVDMAGWVKTKIHSPAKGIVKRAGNYGSYGRFIEIDHQNGFKTRYGHLHKIEVKKGQEVSEGDVIGLMGSSGRSTSTHLHYEVLFNNKQINPLKFIKVLQDVL